MHEPCIQAVKGVSINCLASDRDADVLRNLGDSWFGCFEMLGWSRFAQYASTRTFWPNFGAKPVGPLHPIRADLRGFARIISSKTEQHFDRDWGVYRSHPLTAHCKPTLPMPSLVPKTREHHGKSCFSEVDRHEFGDDFPNALGTGLAQPQGPRIMTDKNHIAAGCCEMIQEPWAFQHSSSSSERNAATDSSRCRSTGNSQQQ